MLSKEIIIIEENQPSPKALMDFNQYVFEVVKEYCDKNGESMEWEHE